MTGHLVGARFAVLLLQMETNPGGMTPDQQTQVALQALKGPGTLVGIMVPLAFFATVVVIFWLLLRQRQIRIQARAEFKNNCWTNSIQGGNLAISWKARQASNSYRSYGRRARGQKVEC